MTIPGDFSAAAFFLAAAACAQDGDVTVSNVGINPTRTGFLDALSAMGADMQISPCSNGAEPTANIRIRSCPLSGTKICGDLIPRLIDELPILAVVASYAKGVTTISDAQELRHKETDRIEAIADMLRRASIPWKPPQMV